MKNKSRSKNKAVKGSSTRGTLKKKVGYPKLHIVKRQGHYEPYDERKVYASCYSACLGTHLTKAEAEKVCAIVSKEVTKWVHKQKELTSDNIFDRVVQILKIINEDVAFMYETHRDIS